MFFLTSERLKFRNWTREDIILAYSLWGDAEVTRFIGGPLKYDAIQNKIEKEIDTYKQYGVQYWPLFTNQFFIGCCGLRPYDADKGIL